MKNCDKLSQFVRPIGVSDYPLLLPKDELQTLVLNELNKEI
ncbi:MAG: hypothetical protein Q4G28_04845 [Neisseria sp.]|nr:hypothetical protein [Neisseria sp.]